MGLNDRATGKACGDHDRAGTCCHWPGMSGISKSNNCNGLETPTPCNGALAGNIVWPVFGDSNAVEGGSSSAMGNTAGARDSGRHYNSR